MSAKNGSAVTFHKRGLIGLAILAVFALSAVFSSAASASPPVTSTYLAMGDSLAFGYSKQLFNENLGTGEAAAGFEHGYVQDYWKQKTPAKNGIQLQNLGCPGETTDSMIGNGPLGSAIDPTAEKACKYHETEAEEIDAKAAAKSEPEPFPAGYKFPLHKEYGTNPTFHNNNSQLEAALELLAVDALGGKPVTTLSLNIGANDQLHAVAKCEEEAFIKYLKGEITAGEIEKEVLKCVNEHAFAVAAHITENVGLTLFVLRKAEEFGYPVAYGGKVIFVGAYDPYGNLLAFPSRKELTEGVDDEVLPGSNFLVVETNKAIRVNAVEPFGGCFANTDPKFNPQNFTEPNKLQKWTNMANTGITNGQKDGPDIHPTPTGYSVMKTVIVNACGL